MNPAEKIRAANSRLAQIATGCRDREARSQLQEIVKSITATLVEAEAPPKNLAALPKVFR